MPFFKLCALLCVSVLSMPGQDAERNFAGVWNLKGAESEIRSSPVPAPEVLKIDHTGDVIACANGWRFKTDGTETKFPMSQGFTSASRTKWEGRALLISWVVSGPRNFSISDRWALSRDRSTLRIRRQIVNLHGEVESNLVYEREGAAVSKVTEEEQPSVAAASVVVPSVAAPSDVKPKQQEMTYIIAAGTRIPLKLVKALSTKTASEGDRVYLETAFPVVAEGRMVIPPGSAVAGTVTNVVRPGKIKGRGELFLRFDTVILPNGVVREFRARPDGLDAEAGGTLDRDEGRIQSPGSKAEDAKKAGKAAATGAAVGSMAGSIGGRPGMGAGVGALGGAAAGLAGVMLSRGSETVLARGSILEMKTDRPLVFLESELGRR